MTAGEFMAGFNSGARSAPALVKPYTTGFAYVSNRDRQAWAARATSPEQWDAWKRGQWVHADGQVRPESEAPR